MTNLDFDLNSYDYELPPELIAERPVAGRSGSKLLVYDQQHDKIIHTTFECIGEYLPQESTLVLNQSRVFACRLLGQKTSGGKVEIFFLDPHGRDGQYQVLIKCRGKKNVGDKYLFEHDLQLEIVQVCDGHFFVKSNQKDILAYLDEYAKIPIPPYIRSGESDKQDVEDYQTVFAKDVGSVAAPTAGLHFTNELFSKLEEAGIEKSFVTLHVGMGTFAPVKTDDIRNHSMHSESFCVDKSNWEKINGAKKRIAVGTTSLRTLESIWRFYKSDFQTDALYETDIFLFPGQKILSVDGLVTNFHLPKSTLLMLVSTLIGREKTLELYNEAVKNNYRFFSYGDAMLILRKEDKK